MTELNDVRRRLAYWRAASDTEESILFLGWTVETLIEYLQEKEDRVYEQKDPGPLPTEPPRGSLPGEC